ncbi:MAG: OHCU decarboxylase, partial [Actinomycetia bacterium]|nr:OHCU decarboxylase [Actinomycetes bacterium]
MPTSKLMALNDAPEEQAADRLAACNASERWIDHVLAGRPYADAESLLAEATRAARWLDWSDVRQALDAHPRIGDRAPGESAEAEWSRRE